MWGLIAVIGIALVLSLVLVGSFGWFKFSQYRAQALPTNPMPGHPQVNITHPIQSSQFPLGVPIIVETTAFSTQKILSIELYINGELVQVQSAPPGGSESVQAEFLIQPPEEGAHSLIASAYGADQLTSYSSPVQIMISAPGYDPNVDNDVPNAIPAIADQTTSIDFPGQDDYANPAGQWQGTPGNWFNSMAAEAAPNAPELAASTEDCSVMLSIHDFSDNEEGFEVWRLLPNSPTWARIDVLASQSQHEWITYADDGTQAASMYYVSAFNSAGVRTSNLVRASVDPVNCPPPTPKQSALVLELKDLQMTLLQ